MKYESVKLLFQQDKYVQVVSVLSLIVFGYSFYHMSTSLVSNMQASTSKRIYEVHTGEVTVRNEIYSGESWILAKCEKPVGYCWQAISHTK